MNWREFHKRYIVETEAKTTIDVVFEENTPLFVKGHSSITAIHYARVVRRDSLKVAKEYRVHLSENEIRSVSNDLREQIKKDFNIQELGDAMVDGTRDEREDLPISV